MPHLLASDADEKKTSMMKKMMKKKMMVPMVMDDDDASFDGMREVGCEEKRQCKMQLQLKWWFDDSNK